MTDPEVAGQDIFQRLVPMEAHEASSLYRYISLYCILLIRYGKTNSFFLFYFGDSEEKAKLLRRIGGMIDEKDQELTIFLTSLQVCRISNY